MLQKISVIEKCQGEERERGGHHEFPSKICCLTVPSNFVGEICVSENFWYRKMLRIRERERERASRFSVENLLSHNTEKLRRGNLCFRKVLVSKNVKDKRERGHHDFPSKLCCLTVPKNFAGGNLCFRKFLVSKNVKDKRERGASRLSIENLLSHNTEKLRRGTCVSENSGIEKC